MTQNAPFRIPATIWFGEGALSNVGKECKRLGAAKVLIVTDKQVAGSGLVDYLYPLLEAEKIEYNLYDEVEPEPPVPNFEKSLEHLKKDNYDLLIGLGGGSSLDTMKLLSIMHTNPGSVEDYFGVDLVKKRGIPTIAIPTTAGTGSEVTAIGILTKVEEKLKIGVVSPFLIPDVAIVDPVLTVSMPPKVTASTGMDALAHAIEAYTSINATEMTDMYAVEAIKLIAAHLRGAYARGSNRQARQAMAQASLYAGIAFANAGVNAVHALSFPLGGKYKIPHGMANAILLPHVMEYNMLGNVEKFAHIAAFMNENIETLSPIQAAEKSVEAVTRLAEDIGIPLSLKALNMSEQDIDPLAEGAITVTRLLKNNPRDIDVDAIRGIYRRAMQ